MACRDMEKASTALKEVTEASGSGTVVTRKLDLSDTKSIREFAELINKGRLTENEVRMGGRLIHADNCGRSVFTFRGEAGEHSDQQRWSDGVSIWQNSRWL